MKTLAEGGERRRRWRFVHVGYRMFYMNIHPSTCGFALRQNDDIVSYKKLHVTALCPVLWYFLVTSSATPLQSLAVAASSNLILGIKERQGGEPTILKIYLRESVGNVTTLHKPNGCKVQILRQLRCQRSRRARARENSVYTEWRMFDCPHLSLTL